MCTVRMHLPRAHPRSRGEHTSSLRLARLPRGSSPLARGTQQIRHGGQYRRGLIPARAGNTLARADRRGVHRAHPRSRGEHSPIVTASMVNKGSSPLARGTRRGALQSHRQLGLIPARAGNTRRSGTRRHRVWAHPRSRGEHNRVTEHAQGVQGSSPLARGTRYGCGCS